MARENCLMELRAGMLLLVKRGKLGDEFLFLTEKFTLNDGRTAWNMLAGEHKLWASEDWLLKWAEKPL